MLTHRANRDGTLVALYLGACRVGYAAEGRSGWLWHLTLVRPEGGAYAGRQPSQEAAQAAAARAVGEWVAAAGLSPGPSRAQETGLPAGSGPQWPLAQEPRLPTKKGPIRPKRVL